MKVEYVFQGFDGMIYGDPRTDTPQVIGRVNAQLRRDGAYGRWISGLSKHELAQKGNEDTARLLKLRITDMRVV